MNLAKRVPGGWSIVCGTPILAMTSAVPLARTRTLTKRGAGQRVLGIRRRRSNGGKLLCVLA